MDWPDLVNGSLEFVGGCFLWLNVRAASRDKRFSGVRILPTAFFSLWGLWNLFFYPHLDQWASFAGGVNIVTANMVWVAQMLYYRKASHD